MSVFASAFKALTENAPFPWQSKWYEHLVAGEFGEIATTSIPTGLGKTSVLASWLIAFAKNPVMVPRRVVYVVNRRTVVDQTTAEAERLRARADNAGLPVPAISTLRGQFADNREWSADPSQPAIIVGTVDMIGSRLLFSGYGVGFKAKPLHAGFLGQDVLLIHDEAHLEPAFQELLISIKMEQQRCREFGQFRVVELSATSRGGEAFTLSDADRAQEEVKKRIHARKFVVLHEVADEKKDVSDKLLQLARVHKDSEKAILIFARQVETVIAVVAGLRKEKLSVQQLTGTLRGRERDALVNDPIFRRFFPNAEPADGTVYLVCTSAGEVGVNISADHLVCDLSPFDSMAQRLGRVNRFGNRSDTRIDIVHPISFGKDGKLDALSERRLRTLSLMQILNGDGSPAALGELDLQSRIAAFTPQPIILPASDILFDAWALTTIRDKLPGRPPVAPYLHGVSEYEPPETRVAWRTEVWELRRELDDDKSRKQFQKYAEELLEDYPLKAHEILRDRSDRVFNALKKLDASPETPIWLQADEGAVEVVTLGDLIQADKERISDKTILLPPQAGGLEEGLLTGADYDPSNTDYDVADDWQDNKGRLRKRQWNDDANPKGMRLERAISFGNVEDEDAAPTKIWYWFLRTPDSPNAHGRREYPLQAHLDDAESFAELIVGRLQLPVEIVRAVLNASRFHDLGKRRKLWQQSIGNRLFPSQVWAKSGQRMAVTERSRYRHEFGSSLDVAGEGEFLSLSADMQDLALHLIAAHHGRGRPHFPADEAFDCERPETQAKPLAAETPRRFARLQRKYGRWGLAYLESLVRAADILASQKAEGGGE